MAISQEAINRATQKSIDFLEFAVASMATSLGVNIEDLGPDYIIPVAEDYPSYESYSSLKTMHANLTALES